VVRRMSRCGRDICPLTSVADWGHTSCMGAAGVADRTRIIAGWSLAAFSFALVGTVWISLAGDVRSRPGIEGDLSLSSMLLGSFVVAGFAFSGAALVHLRPRNVLGWLLLVSGLMDAISNSGTAYGARALTDPDRSLPLGLFATWLASWTLVPALLLPALVLPALYPTGRAPSPFWVWHIRVCLVGTALLGLAAATVNGVTNPAVAGTRLPWHAPEAWAWATAGTSAALLVPAAVVTIVGTMVRVARAKTPERQQLLWLVCVVGVMVATIFLPATEGPFTVMFACIPVAVVVGVLRYRLLGIEVVLRRTLLFVPLAVLVALIVGGLTTGLASLFPDGPLPLIAASAVVAILVIPVAGRLRLLVDRLVLGDRADPLALVDRIGAGLQVARDNPVASMLEAVATAAGASYAAVHDAAGGELAALGDLGSTTLDVPLVHGGTELGVLSLGPRRGASRVVAGDERLVLALAPHLAVVVSSRRLAEDLVRERQRVTTATVAERDRLRRDLHDGLGPSLSGIALGLEAASKALMRDPTAVPDLLERTRLEADAAVREVRRVLAGLRPAALDRQGLVEALHETANSLGMGAPGRPRFELRVDALPALPPDVEESAFRIVAESMTNVARHSGAEHCSVEIKQRNGDLRVGVTDDGHGQASIRPMGHGLDSMRRRASDVGGRLTVACIEPHGTAVTVVLPLEASR
jgi:signal transduction histidine kinase